MIDRIYCINLDTRPDRWRLFEQQPGRKSLGNINRISGRTSDSFTSYMKYRSEVKSGELGCTTSHLNILKQIKKFKLNNTIVFEDDAIINPGIKTTIREILSKIHNNYNICYLGGNYVTDMQSSMVTQYDGYMSCKDILSTVGYILNIRCVDQLIRLIRRNMFQKPVDEIYREFQHNNTCYIATPRLVHQQPGYSDICKGYRDYSRMRDF